jgi:SAM-dependent methyltransferase
MAARAWFEEWFDRDYVLLYGHRDERDAEAGVRLALDLLQPASGAWVVDLGCGAGRHALALRRRGFEVVGVDLSPELLRLAAAEAHAAGVDLRLVRADLRRLPFTARFDAAVSFFTSFGYFDDPAEDAGALRSMVACLRLGGSLLMDVINPTYVRQTLEPSSHGTCGDATFTAERRIEGDRVIKTITLTRPSGERTLSESVRLYEAPALAALASAAGLGQVAFRGSYGGEPLAPLSPRLILVGRRER